MPSLKAPIRPCVICLEDMDLAQGETFCGNHLYCRACAVRTAKEELSKGKVPQCPDCKECITPVAAQRILSFEELTRYYNLALWSNDSVAVCPRCRQGLYTDEGTDTVCCRSARCPACTYEFCIECRGPAHPGVLDCDEAARKLKEKKKKEQERRELERPKPEQPELHKKERSNSRHAGVVTTSEGYKASPATPFAVRVAAAHQALHNGGCPPPPPPPVRAYTPPPERDVSFSALGVKACPRCRVACEKIDDDSCDHMTCSNCRFEFCWTCMADRRVILAHGNHYHRPSCKFYAAYNGPDAIEHLPNRCKRCAKRGVACRPFHTVRNDVSRSIIPTTPLFNSIDHFWLAVCEMVTLRNCQAPPR